MRRFETVNVRGWCTVCVCGEFYSAGSNLNLVASTCFLFLILFLSKRAHVAREVLLHWLRKLHGFLVTFFVGCLFLRVHLKHGIFFVIIFVFRFLFNLNFAADLHVF
uniref:(northern house mosquito) hypothetical protein n=1 Tax=Culex pipiens TaxID=7175 RepID=A0A8D8A1G1_CULPI